MTLVGYSAISGLLVLYAVTSGIYSLSSVTMAYEMSRKIANTSWLQLAFSGALVFGIYMFHSTLRQVIEVQLVLMSVLLLFVLVPVLRQGTAPLQFAPSRIHPLGPLSEEEVIAEFLKSEFHHPEFDEYREHSTDLVETPNFDDVSENAWRRAMLFVRRGPMWRELPKDTQWHECEFTVEDLDRATCLSPGPVAQDCARRLLSHQHCRQSAGPHGRAVKRPVFPQALCAEHKTAADRDGPHRDSYWS